MSEYEFVINNPVELEETRFYEFKEVKGGRPLDAIKNTCDEYVVAFLNSSGGRIFWGIRDNDRRAVGVRLSFGERDELRRVATNKLNQIQPPISPTAYQIKLHPIYEDAARAAVVEDLYIVEIVAPQVISHDLYSTGGGEVFVKTDGGKRKLSFQEIQDEIRRRHITEGRSSTPVDNAGSHGAYNRKESLQGANGSDTYNAPSNGISSPTVFGAGADSAAGYTEPESFNAVAAREALKLFDVQSGNPDFSIRYIQTPSELNDLWGIDHSAYEQSSIEYELFYEWWRAFPQGLKVLFYGNNIVGAIGIWPLSHKCCEQFKQGKLKETSLAPNMFRPFRNKGTSHWYVSGIVLRPDFRRSNAIRLLLSGSLTKWLGESLNRYPLEMLALAYSLEGQTLLERFGFLRFQNASAMPDRLPLYKMDFSSQEGFMNLLRKRGLIGESTE